MRSDRFARKLVRRILPLALRRGLRSAFGWRWFRGDYPSWAEARLASTGYDDARIVAQVLQATQLVRAGGAAFERDGVTFPHPLPDGPFLKSLERIRSETGGILRVLDFGGALGSTYWRHQLLLESFAELRWDIVEQPAFVTAGRDYLADSPLRFFASTEDALAVQNYDVLLASCVVQYLEHPASMMRTWCDQRFPWLLLNNVPLHRNLPDRLAVQRVPPTIYEASYPVWFFNRESFLAQLDQRYDLVDDFASEAVWPLGWRLYPSTGLLLRRRVQP